MTLSELDTLSQTLDNLQAGVLEQHRKLEKAVRDQDQFNSYLDEVERKLSQLEAEITALNEPEKQPGSLFEVEELLRQLETIEKRKDELKSRLNEAVELVHPASAGLNEEGRQNIEAQAESLENHWRRFLSILSSARTSWSETYSACQEFEMARQEWLETINDCKRYLSENFALIDLDIEKKKEKLTALKDVDARAQSLGDENMENLKQKADRVQQQMGLSYVSAQYNEVLQSYQQLLTFIQVRSLIKIAASFTASSRFRHVPRTGPRLTNSTSPIRKNSSNSGHGWTDSYSRMRLIMRQHKLRSRRWMLAAKWIHCRYVAP